MGRTSKARANALELFECELRGWPGKTWREAIADAFAHSEPDWEELLAQEPIYSRLAETERREVALVLNELASPTTDPLIQEIQRAAVYWKKLHCGGIHPFMALYLAKRPTSYLPTANHPDIRFAKAHHGVTFRARAKFLETARYRTTITFEAMNEATAAVHGWKREDVSMPRSPRRGGNFHLRAPLPCLPGRRLRHPERDVAAWALHTIPTLPTEPESTLSLGEIARLRSVQRNEMPLFASPARVDEAVCAVERLLGLALTSVKSPNHPD